MILSSLRLFSPVALALNPPSCVQNQGMPASRGAMLLPDPPLFIRRNTLSILPIYIHQPAMHTLLAMLMDELS
ncbi:hypothetical protein C5B78_03710 [Aeromonas salmonicida]|nr:hypothetical protein C5B78_03710 [Aeromonas salmonicida]